MTVTLKWGEERPEDDKVIEISMFRIKKDVMSTMVTYIYQCQARHKQYKNRKLHHSGGNVKLLDYHISIVNME